MSRFRKREAPPASVSGALAQRKNALRTSIAAALALTGTNTPLQEPHRDVHSTMQPRYTLEPILASSPVPALRPLKGILKTPDTFMGLMIHRIREGAVLETGLMEKAQALIEHNLIPLSQQITFLEAILSHQGQYGKELASDTVTVSRLNEIFSLISHVTNRVNANYLSKSQDPALSAHFKLSLRDANRHFPIQVKPQQYPRKIHGNAAQKQNQIFCNGTLVNEGGHVYFVTAKHCVVGTTEEHRYIRGPKRVDQAVRYISPAEYKDPRWRVPENIHSLPSLDATVTPESESGRLVASYSWGPNADYSDIIEKTQFSFLLKLSAHAHSLLHGTKVPHEGTLGFVATPESSKTVGHYTDAQTGEILRRTGSAGSSGSAITRFVAGKNREVIVADFEAITYEDNECAVCFSFALSGDMQHPRKLILQDIQRRQKLGVDRRSRTTHQ